MTNAFRNIWLVPALVAPTIVILDQLAKAWIVQNLGAFEGNSMPLLGEWLKFTFVKNTGVAFGMFQNLPYFFTFTSIIISIGALYFYRYHLPNRNLLIQLCVGAILGGAVGNIIDRIRLGYVVDFVHVTWFPGIFNLADACISCGVVILAVYLMLRGEDALQTTASDDQLLGERQS